MIIFKITFSISSRHMNYIRSNGNLAWITLWPNVQKNFELRSFMSISRSCRLKSCCSVSSLGTSDGLWLHNFLRSILNIIRLLENIRRFSTCWTSFDILAFHYFVESFFTATALEILRQMLSQYLQVRITFRAFVHMNQSLCTSWCFIKSIKMQITWSWMKTETRRQS